MRAYLQSTETPRVPALRPREIEELTELVYQLLRDDLLLGRERHGASSADWR